MSKKNKKLNKKLDKLELERMPLLAEARDIKSMEVFGRHEEELTQREKFELDAWMAPRWKLVQTRKGDWVEVNNVGQVRNPETKELYKVYYPDHNRSTASYPSVWLPLDKEGKHFYSQSVHQLVAKAFCPNDDPEHKTEVNHIDCDKCHNWAGNLEWVTRGENVSHRYRMNPNDKSLGENSHFNKYSEKQIIKACELMSTRPEMSESWVSRQTGVSRWMLPLLRSKSSWKNITEKYDFPPKPPVWFSSDKSAREYELLKQGYTISEAVDKIIQEFNLNISRKKLYSQIHAMRRDWIAKGALPGPNTKGEMSNGNIQR